MTPAPRWVVALGAAVVAVAAGGCGGGSSPARSTGAAPHDPKTAAALLRIASAFNHDYATNRDAAVYARWDPASRAVISRAGYLQRHRDCPSPPEQDVRTWGVAHGPGGAWLVHYSIGGQQFTDWWYYVDGRFEFDLPRSNPSAVALYRSSPAQYAKAVGCTH